MSQPKDVVFQVVLFGALAATGAWAQAPTAPETGTALWRGMQVHYVMRNGLPIYQGDIILDNPIFGPDPTGTSRERPPASTLSRESPRTLGEIYSGTLWPSVSGVYQIPYIITNGSSNLNTAISEYNTTFSGLIQWVPRSTQTDYVNFYLNPSDQSGGGESTIGRAGGEQSTNCAINCSVGTLAHEMGHATGLWHEQSRSDRSTYITLDYSHIQAAVGSNDSIATSNAWIYGPYDYASVMEYQTFSDTADGSQTIQSIPAGIPLGNGNYYTTADIDTIRRLYSAAPTSVTVDTNPTGLQVIVDGTTITTPQTYSNWTLNSNHTLAIPAGLSNSGLQSQAAPPINGTSPGELYYQFGRWNDGGAASHTITITPGTGMPGYPPTAPGQTVYTANFIQWVPFTPSPSGSFPSGAGTLTTTPSPTTFSGVGQFFLANQNVAINASANTGYNFVQWYGAFYCESCYISFQANPLSYHYWSTQNPEPGFTASQVTTITTNPPGLNVQVDNSSYTSPVRFSPDTNVSGSAWAPGTIHTVSVASPQNPWSQNTSYVWSNWSDAQSQSHSITVASGNSTITANFNTQLGLVLATNSNSNCAGSVAANPPGPSNAGTSVTFTATPNSGFVFTKWEGALSGSTNPSIGPVNQEEFVQADFNMISSPLAITSFSPTSVSAGSGPFTLTINGTGFTAPPVGSGNTGGYAYVWSNGSYFYRTMTYVSPTQIQIPILTGDVANTGTVGILVENIVNGSCWVMATAEVPVSTALTAVTIQTSPTGLEFTVDGGVAQTAPQTLNLTQGSHTIAVATTQAGAAGTQYVFTGWSDSGAASHGITVGASSPSPYTASFKTQYQLTISASPGAGGSVTPTTGIFYDAATVVPITATANSGYVFGSWSGSVASPSSASTTVTMGTAQTVVANFTVVSAGPISPVSVSPASGSGATQTFTFTFNDPNGYANLSVVDVLINNFVDGRNACYVGVAPASASSGSVYLVDNAGDGNYASGSPLVLPSSGTVANSQCTISGTGSSISGSGNTLTLTLNITFAAGFAGNRIFNLAAISSTQNSGWQALGTWNVPGGSAPVGPAVVGMSPGRSNTMGQTYTFTFSDTNGFADLSVMDVLVNNALTGVSACYLAFVPSSATAGTIFLVDNAGDGNYAPGSPISIPSSSTVQNNQCSISGTGSSVSASSNTLILNLAIAFNSGFAGNQVFYLAALGHAGGNSGWQAVGSVTVP